MSSDRVLHLGTGLNTRDDLFSLCFGGGSERSDVDDRRNVSLNCGELSNSGLALVPKGMCGGGAINPTARVGSRQADRP